MLENHYKWGFIMRDEDKSKEQLIKELIELRLQNSKFQASIIQQDMKNILSIILELLPNAIIVTDLEGRTIYINKVTEQITGYLRHELIGKFPGILNAEENAYLIQQEIYDYMRNSKKWCGELLQRRKDGSTYLAEFEILPVLKDGFPVVWFSVQRDITQRKQAEEALCLSEELFSKAFNKSPVSMFIKSLETGRYVCVNKSLCQYMGYTQEEIIGQTLIGLKIFVDPNNGLNDIKRIKKQGLIHNLKASYHTKSGEIRSALLSTSLINISNEDCILFVILDVTEREKVECEMLRLSRLNLIGEMAAGIAHEVRNPMTTVRGFLQMLGSKKEYNQSKEYFNLMIEELDRANSIITEFLTLAKNKPIELKIENLNDIVKNISPLIAADSIVADKYLELELNEIPDLLIDESEIRQLILNLVRNGLDAISSGEYLTIKTYFDGSEVVLSVQDCGKGIPSDILDKIGTPFFTTKDNGTGLGLATCYSIANRHNASIKIDTGPEGTTFYVRFKMSA